MKPTGMESGEDREVERRRDGPVEVIDEAVVLASVDGVGPALEYMADSGVPHETALRVLAGPTFHRTPGSRTLEKVMNFISSRLRRRKE